MTVGYLIHDQEEPWGMITPQQIHGPTRSRSRSSSPSLVQVNLVGAMRVTQAFLPLLRMEGRQPGRIVNMSSQVRR